MRYNHKFAYVQELEDVFVQLKATVENVVFPYLRVRLESVTSIEWVQGHIVSVKQPENAT